MKTRLRLITADDGLAASLRAGLEAEGFEVAAAAAVESLPPVSGVSALLIDLDGRRERWADLRAVRRRPDSDGWVVVAASRTRGGTAELVEAFHRGLDEFIVLPADGRLVAARVRALCRLRERSLRPHGPLKTRDGVLQLDRGARQAWVRTNGRRRELGLTAKEFEVLACLLSRRNRLVRREELLTAVWPDAAIEENSRTLVQHVLHLREKLGAAAGRLETVRGLGYRLNDPS